MDARPPEQPPAACTPAKMTIHELAQAYRQGRIRYQQGMEIPPGWIVSHKGRDLVGRLEPNGWLCPQCDQVNPPFKMIVIDTCAHCGYTDDSQVDDWSDSEPLQPPTPGGEILRPLTDAELISDIETGLTYPKWAPQYWPSQKPTP